MTRRCRSSAAEGRTLGPRECRSIAGLLLTTEAVISEIKEDKPEIPAGGGGMGGMGGGMGGMGGMGF